MFADKMTNSKRYTEMLRMLWLFAKYLKIWALVLKAKELKDWAYKTAETLVAGYLSPVAYWSGHSRGELAVLD